MQRNGKIWFVVAVIASAMSAVAHAQAPRTLAYQARLLNADGTPAVGVVPIRFALFANADGGQPLWDELQQVALTDGYYAVHLGDVTPIPTAALDGTERFLQLTIDGEPLRPRHRVTSVPYAIRAQTARDVEGGVVAASRITVAGQTVIDDAGKLAGPAAYSAGGGLELANGAFALRNCAVGEVLKYGSTGWACAPDADTACTAASGGGLAASGTALALQSCASGQVLKHDGARWVCAADADTMCTVANGGGLWQSGTELALRTCLPGEVLKHGASGWACAADEDRDTTYSVATGGGIALSGTRLALQSCASGQVLKHDGAQWTCAPDNDSGGTVKSVTASLPLVSSGGATPNLSLSSSGCTSGQALKWSGSSWVCQADADTTYSVASGGGLALSGGAFGLQTCAEGQVLKRGATGWACAADANSGGTITSVTASGPISIGGSAVAPVVSIARSSPSVDGYLSSTDFVRFDGKVDTSDVRLSDARDPKAGSDHYIQNQVAAPQNAGLSITGNALIGGKVGIGTTTPGPHNLNMTGSFRVGNTIYNAYSTALPLTGSQDTRPLHLKTAWVCMTTTGLMYNLEFKGHHYVAGSEINIIAVGELWTTCPNATGLCKTSTRTVSGGVTARVYCSAVDRKVVFALTQTSGYPEWHASDLVVNFIGGGSGYQKRGADSFEIVDARHSTTDI